MKKSSISVSDFISICISRQIVDGELVAQGIATPTVAAGILLAKLTHAPNITFISAIGQAVCRDWAPLGLATVEKLWIEKGIFSVGMVRAAADLLPQLVPKEFFRPGQVDAFGNFNNVFIGGSFERPRLRLPGSGGIPDVTVYSDKVYLYVPRHGRHTMVETIDFKSCLGHDSKREKESGPRYLVSDLGQFDFEESSGRMRILSLHPGITLARVQAKTGFDLVMPDHIPVTELPTLEELNLLEHEIDPLGIRSLETLAGHRRKKELRRILLLELDSN